VNGYWTQDDCLAKSIPCLTQESNRLSEFEARVCGERKGAVSPGNVDSHKLALFRYAEVHRYDHESSFPQRNASAPPPGSPRSTLPGSHSFDRAGGDRRGEGGEGGVEEGVFGSPRPQKKYMRDRLQRQAVDAVIKNAGVNEADELRGRRASADEHFRELCRATEDLQRHRVQQVALHHEQCRPPVSSVADALQWS